MRLSRILNQGFSLIELMVVIAIISILSSIIYANFSDSKNVAKNRALQSDLKSTQLALEVYKAQNGSYPPAYGPCKTSVLGIDSVDSTCGAPYIDGMVPDFIGQLPDESESNNANCVIEYKVPTDGSWYKLTAERCLAGASSPAKGVQPDSEFARCLSSCGVVCATVYTDTATFYESYAVYSAGGECQL